jgi:hypothetical protein
MIFLEGFLGLVFELQIFGEYFGGVVEKVGFINSNCCIEIFKIGKS